MWKQNLKKELSTLYESFKGIIVMHKYDYIVVGAGLAGGVIARRLAEKNKKILIVERRNHIAGNMYDYDDEHEIKVQKYGPHVFHTNNDEVYTFITNYCEVEKYRTKCEAVIDGVYTPSPFNFKTIDQFYDVESAEKLKGRLLDYYAGRSSVTVVELLESEDQMIRGFAQFLFDKDYKLYTAKQWNLDPSEIDPSVLKRVPIVLSYGDTYFYDKYEFMPKKGFVDFYKTLTNHNNITFNLNTDALKHIEIDEENKKILYDNNEATIIYTGAIDELFDYKFGTLPYRSLYFDFKSIEVDSFQSSAIVAYPQEDGYTRITEYTKMPFQRRGGWTSVAYEYPIIYDKRSQKGSEPYYPVLTDDSMEKYSYYKSYAECFDNLILVGRLAEFKYYNMDQVILKAIEIFEQMEVD